MELALFIVSLCVFVLILLVLFYLVRRQRALQDALTDDLSRALSELRRELGSNVQNSVANLGRHDSRATTHKRCAKRTAVQDV